MDGKTFMLDAQPDHRASAAATREKQPDIHPELQQTLNQ